MPRYQRKRTIIEAVQWTGNEACLEGTPFAGLLTGRTEQRGENLFIHPGSERREYTLHCKPGNWIVADSVGVLEIMSNAAFTQIYESLHDQD